MKIIAAIEDPPVGILGRIVNYRGAEGFRRRPQAPIPGISAPILFRKAFTEAQDKAQSRR